MLPAAYSQLALKAGIVVTLVWMTARTLGRTLFPWNEPTEAAVPHPTVAKVSVLYGEETEYYERAIASHERHAQRHNHPLHVLQRPVADGYWNKALYILSILIQELGKPSNERVRWLM
jgi:hypothetical protein